MEQTRIPLQTYDYRPSSRGDIRRPRTNGRRRNTLQAGTSVSPNPQKEVDTYYSYISFLDVINKSVSLYNVILYMYYITKCEKPKEMDHLKDISIDGRLILKWLLYI